MRSGVVGEQVVFSLPVLSGFLLFLPHPAAAVLRLSPLADTHDGSHQTKIVCCPTGRRALTPELFHHRPICERAAVSMETDYIKTVLM